MLPTSFSLRLYCREPACTPSCISFALLLVNAPHLILSAVVLWRACSRSLMHFPCTPPGPHVPCTLPSRSPRSMAPHGFSLWLNCGEPVRALPHIPCAPPLGQWLLTGSLCGYTVRACSRSPSCSSIFTPLLALLPQTPLGDTCTCEAYIYIICTNLCLLLASRHSPSTCH